MENDKISLTNLFQHLLSAEILSEWKIEFILPYLVRNFQINARNKLTAKCLLTFSHYKYIPYSSRPVLELQVCSYCLNIKSGPVKYCFNYVSIGNC